jgi:hypothetical protein
MRRQPSRIGDGSDTIALLPESLARCEAGYACFHESLRACPTDRRFHPPAATLKSRADPCRAERGRLSGVSPTTLRGDLIAMSRDLGFSLKDVGDTPIPGWRLTFDNWGMQRRIAEVDARLPRSRPCAKLVSHIAWLNSANSNSPSVRQASPLAQATRTAPYNLLRHAHWLPAAYPPQPLTDPWEPLFARGPKTPCSWRRFATPTATRGFAHVDDLTLAATPWACLPWGRPSTPGGEKASRHGVARSGLQTRAGG